MIMYGGELCPPSEWNNYYLIVDQSAIDDNNLIQVLQRRICKVAYVGILWTEIVKESCLN